MSNYTTQTASIKATTIDTRKIDTKQIDTEKLFINGELFDPSQIKESPNDTFFWWAVDVNGTWFLQSLVSDSDGNFLVGKNGELTIGSQTGGILENGIYAIIEIDDDFLKSIGVNGSSEAYDMVGSSCILGAKFLVIKETSSIPFENCILENFLSMIDEQPTWVIKICEEDDNFFELYGGITEENPYFMFVISIPYYIPENDTSSSTYSLRKTNPIDSLRERFEQMRQQMLDNPSE